MLGITRGTIKVTGSKVIITVVLSLGYISAPLSVFKSKKNRHPIENWISVILSSFRLLQKGKMLKTISGTQKVTGSKVRIAVVLSLGYISAFSAVLKSKKKIRPPIETGSQSVFTLKIRPRCPKIGDFFLFSETKFGAPETTYPDF